MIVAAAPLALAAALFSLPPVARAQTAAPADPAKDEVITLSRFDVRESTDNSYGVANATAGLKSQQPLLDISAPIQVLPRILMDDLGANWLTTDYARFVSSGLNSYGANNQFYLRGQRVTPMFKNGVQYFSSVDDAFSIETVEVVKGVNSSLFGSMPQVSGMVMESTKIPLSTEKGTFGISGLGDGAILRSELDTTGPLAKDLLGARVSYRFLAVGQTGDMKQIDHDNRIVYSPSLQLDWKRTTLRFRYEYSDITDFGLYNNNFLDQNNQVSTIGGRDETYKAKWSRSRFKKSEAETNLITRFTSDFEGRLQLAYYQELRTDHDNRAFLVASPTATSLAGNTIIPVTPTSLLGSTVLDLAQTQQTFAINDDYVANYAVGGSAQQTNFGFSADYLYNSQGLVQPFLGYMSVIHPVYSADPGPQPIPGSATTITGTTTACMYVQDQAKLLSDRLIVTLGGNWAYNGQITHKPIGPAAVYQESKGSDLTYKVAAVYKIVPQLAAYVSRATAFVPQAPTATGPGGAPIPPITSTDNEVGIKTDNFLNGLVTGSIAGFSSTSLNQPVVVNAGTANTYYVNGGRTDTRGLEFDLTLKPVTGWEIIGTLFHGNGVFNSDAYTVNGLPVGDYANRSFKSTWSVLTKYRFASGSLKGLVIGANGFHMGEIFVPPAPALPASTRYSVFASYPFGQVQVNVDVDNVTDQVYAAGGNQRYSITIGDPRNVKISLKYKF